MEIENIIKSKNSEFYKKHPYNPKTWISISNIKTYLKPEFDKEGVAKRTSEKYFNENNNLCQEKEKYKLLYTELISKFNSSYQYDSSLLSDPINALSQAKQKNILLLQKLNLLSK